MGYNVYINKGKGYEDAIPKSDKYELIGYLDKIIDSQKVQKILVTEWIAKQKHHDITFLYTGDYKDYESFREDFLTNKVDGEPKQLIKRRNNL